MMRTDVCMRKRHAAHVQRYNHETADSVVKPIYNKLCDLHAIKKLNISFLMSETNK